MCSWELRPVHTRPNWRLLGRFHLFRRSPRRQTQVISFAVGQTLSPQKEDLPRQTRELAKRSRSIIPGFHCQGFLVMKQSVLEIFSVRGDFSRVLLLVFNGDYSTSVASMRRSSKRRARTPKPSCDTGVPYCAPLKMSKTRSVSLHSQKFDGT